MLHSESAVRYIHRILFLLNKILHRKKPLYLSPLSITWAMQKMSYAATDSNGTAKTRSMGLLDFSQRKDNMGLNPQISLTDCDWGILLSHLHRELSVQEESCKEWKVSGKSVLGSAHRAYSLCTTSALLQHRPRRRGCAITLLTPDLKAACQLC